ncbi:MAG: DUF1232 domain-containing protein [bacterium]|nr:DUF1232 domain-containing protein [bacterium]
MKELKVTFTLDAKDVDHLRRILQRSQSSVLKKTEDGVIGAALVLAREVRKFSPPEYVMERVERLESFVDMINDQDWALPVSVKRKVLGALAYFTDAEDLIADPVPGLGFLDDAIMIELVTRELRHELVGYRDFCDFRETVEQRPWTPAAQKALPGRLKTKRKQLRERIERNEIRAAEKAALGTRGRLRKLW